MPINSYNIFENLWKEINVIFLDGTEIPVAPQHCNLGIFTQKLPCLGIF